MVAGCHNIGTEGVQKYYKHRKILQYRGRTQGNSARQQNGWKKAERGTNDIKLTNKVILCKFQFFKQHKGRYGFG